METTRTFFSNKAARILIVTILWAIWMNPEPLFAKNNIHVFKPLSGTNGILDYGIVSDSDEWACHITQQTNTISGHNKKNPMSFHFKIVRYAFDNLGNKINEKNIMKFAENYLREYATQNSTIFYSVVFAEDQKTHFIIKGEYMDSTYCGGFALYIQPIECNPPTAYGPINHYLMHIDIKENLLKEPLEEEVRNVLYSKCFDLITPIYTPK